MVSLSSLTTPLLNGTVPGFSAGLLEATIAGIPFQIIDTSVEVGRRLQRFLFPGVDAAAFEDLGALDGPIALRGVLIGADYVQQATLLRTALRTQGPLSLVHPWLGNIQVVLLAPGRVTFSFKEIRCAHFEVRLYPWTPPSLPGSNSLAGLELAVTSAIDAAQSYMITALTPFRNAAGAFSAVQSWTASIAGQLAAVAQTGPSGDVVGPAASSAIATLSAPTSAPSTGWQATAVGNVLAVPAAIGAAASPPIPAAVAPGGATTPAPAADPGDTTAMLLAAATIAQASGSSAGGHAVGTLSSLAAGLQAACVAQAAQTASLIDYVSAQDAETEVGRLMTAIDAAIVAAGTLAETDPLNAAPVWQSLHDLKSAVATNFNSLVGSLPQVVSVELSSAVPAWLVAHYIAGDTPSAMYATWQDLLARNGVGAPATLGPGIIEVLNAA